MAHEIYVTSFFSIPYYSNLRLISKKDLEAHLQYIRNLCSTSIHLPPPCVVVQTNITPFLREQTNFLSDLVSKLVSNSSIREAVRFSCVLHSNQVLRPKSLIHPHKRRTTTLGTLVVVIHINHSVTYIVTQ